jgi:hypothetical protein
MTAGAQIFDLPNWNVLMTILMDGDSSPAYKAGVGNVLLGTNGGFQAGETVAADAVLIVCLSCYTHSVCLLLIAYNLYSRLRQYNSKSP